MNAWMCTRWAALVWCAAAIGPVSAQDTSVGVVRISDQKPLNVQPVSRSRRMAEYGAPMAAAGDPACMPGGPISAYDTLIATGAMKVKHGAGVCPGGCMHCKGAGCWHCKHCKHGCKAGACKVCLAACFQEHYCKNSPDYGYSIPGKYPIERRSVQYLNYFPSAWYGTGGAVAPAAPMVYTPTDTTQLGYYYQHVPFWLPQPNPLPQRPIPAQWNNYAPPIGASAFSNYAGGLAGACPTVNGMLVNGMPMDGMPVNGMPVDGTVVDPNAMPIDSVQPVPSDQPPAPRPPMDESAVRTPFQRVSGR